MSKLFELAALALLPLFLAADFSFRARQFRKPRFWRLRALAVTVGIVVWSTWFALTLGGLLEGVALFDLAGLGLWGAPVGVLVYEFGHYWYHRAAHRFDWLWRAGHQLHHSAESLDAFGAYWLHPIDAALFTAIQSVVLYPLLGLSPEAGALAALWLTFNALFQHANLRTPAWLGYVIQRPEAHLVHHGRGVHAWNYADLPLWDMVFGTFQRPAREDEFGLGLAPIPPSPATGEGEVRCPALGSFPRLRGKAGMGAGSCRTAPLLHAVETFTFGPPSRWGDADVGHDQGRGESGERIDRLGFARHERPWQRFAGGAPARR